jgi:ADP-heptose:LPS heptosyltransferase
MRRGRKSNRLLDFWIGVPLLRLLSCFRWKRAALPGKIDRIGILCSAALGDTLLISGVVADLRRHFPQQQLIFFCTPQNEAAAELIPGIDKLVRYRLTAPHSAVRAIRAEKLDLLVDFSGWQRFTALCSALSGAKFTAGFRTSGQRRHYGYDIVADHTNTRHEMENFRALLDAIHVPSGHAPYIVFRPATLPEDFVGRRTVVLHLWPAGAKSWLREWPQERWIALAKRLTSIIPEPLYVITGSRSDLPQSEAFVQKMTEAGLDARTFTGSDGLSSLCHLLMAARLVISTNTGVMHLAAILGARTLSLNGPTNNLRWGPFGPRAMGVDPPGQGCGYLDLGFEFDGNPTDCMQRISVDQVFEAADLILQK